MFLKKEKSCGAVIYRYNINKLEILLLKHGKGHWSFAKGHVLDGETEEETAIREIKEETNLDCVLDNSFRFINTYSPKKDVIKDVIYFVGYSSNDDVTVDNNEISEYKWLSIDNAYDTLTYDNDKEVLRKVIEYITDEKKNNKSVR